MSSRTAFILGAGFSRAVSQYMPLTDELGDACRDLVPAHPEIPSDGFANGFFEVWLSQLAEEQPYLNVQSNLENQAMFHRFSYAIASVLEQRVVQALVAGWPAWFPAFVKIAHHRRSTVVTFNYDTLIECAVGTGLLYEWGMREPIYWVEVTGDVPNWPPGTMRFASEPADTFRLLKLHGSLNWYWNPGDTSGASVARRDLPGVYGAPIPYTEDDRRRHLPGRQPLIVPPSATKSAYYRNPITREMWQQAAVALSVADEVVIIGYSLPITDLTFGSLFRRAVASRDVKVIVVDLAGSAVAERLTWTGVDPSCIEVIDRATAHSPVEEFVRRRVTGISVEALSTLITNGAQEAPIMIALSPDKCATVRSVQRVDGEVVLRTGPARAPGLLGRTDDQGGELIADLPTLRALAGSSGPMVVEFPDGVRQAVLAFGRANFATGYSTWNVLYTTGGAW